MNDQSKNWYLVYTKARQEKLAAENLVRQGYHVLAPRIKVRRRRNGRYIEVVEAMFPRYVFIQLNTSTDNWHPIKSTYGVSRLIYFGMEPAIVPDALITLLVSQQEEDGLQLQPETILKKGDQVRIIEGVMNGYEAVFLSNSSSERVKILLEYAGNVAEVEISSHHIEHAL